MPKSATSCLYHTANRQALVRAMYSASAVLRLTDTCSLLFHPTRLPNRNATHPVRLRRDTELDKSESHATMIGLWRSMWCCRFIREKFPFGVPEVGEDGERDGEMSIRRVGHVLRSEGDGKNDFRMSEVG